MVALDAAVLVAAAVRAACEAGAPRRTVAAVAAAAVSAAAGTTAAAKSRQSSVPRPAPPGGEGGSEDELVRKLRERRAARRRAKRQKQKQDKTTTDTVTSLADVAEGTCDGGSVAVSVGAQAHQQVQPSQPSTGCTPPQKRAKAEKKGMASVVPRPRLPPVPVFPGAHQPDALGARAAESPLSPNPRGLGMEMAHSSPSSIQDSDPERLPGPGM